MTRPLRPAIESRDQRYPTRGTAVNAPQAGPLNSFRNTSYFSDERTDRLGNLRRPVRLVRFHSLNNGTADDRPIRQPFELLQMVRLRDSEADADRPIRQRLQLPDALGQILWQL